MITKRKITISVDEDVFKNSKEILKASGLKFSSFIETMLIALIESEEKPMQDVYGNMLGRWMKTINKEK